MVMTLIDDIPDSSGNLVVKQYGRSRQ